MLPIDQALDRIKGNLEHYVPASLVQRLADRFHLGQRRRTLTPVVPTFLFLKQVLEGNTACGHLIRISNLDFTESAYCRARGRLPFCFFHALQNEVTGHCFSAEPLRPEQRWHGHDVYFLDGSSFSMPDTPELQAAGRSGRTPAEPSPPGGAQKETRTGQRRPAEDHPWRKPFQRKHGQHPDTGHF